MRPVAFLFALVASLALATTALAWPPRVGATHYFYDPIFDGIVVCDTLDQVQEIAQAKDPGKVYSGYMYQRNARNEPICLAIAPTARVVSVTYLGIMHRDSLHLWAWAVEVKLNGIVAYALYLEDAEVEYL